MKNKTIIAIVGMAGSGKSEAVNYLQKKYNYPKVYFGEATFDRLKKEGLELNYANEKNIREKIRQEMGMGAYAILAMPKIDSIFEKSGMVLVESLYSWDEYKVLKNKYSDKFKVIAIFASPEIRFARLKSRLKERPIDDIDTFNRRDLTEIEGTDKGGPIARADHMIINHGTLEELHAELDSAIAEITAALPKANDVI